MVTYKYEPNSGKYNAKIKETFYCSVFSGVASFVLPLGCKLSYLVDVQLECAEEAPIECVRNVRLFGFEGFEAAVAHSAFGRLYWPCRKPVQRAAVHNYAS